MKRLRGEVTLFLLLVSVLIFSLIAVTLEGARSACLDYLTRQAADSGIRSVFAAYDTELMKLSGLLAVRGREGDSLSWTETAETYLRKYLEPGGGCGEGDRVRLSSVELTETRSVFLTDDEGKVFADAVLAYMKSAGMSALIRDLLDRFSALGENAEDLKNTTEGILSEDLSLKSVLKNYKDLKSSAEELLEQMRREAEEAGGTGSGEAADEAAAGQEEAAETEAEEEVPPETLSLGNSLKELLEKLKQLDQQGILMLLLQDSEISTRSWEEADLPSKLSREEKRRSSGFAKADYSFGEKLLLTEYALSNCGCYTERKGGGMQYELEYILCGGRTDKDALENTASRIMLLRTCFNVLFLVADEQKMTEIQAAAAALCAALQLPIPLDLASGLILALWAIVEAVADLRSLMKGGTVPVIKTAADWKMSVISLENAAGETGGSRLGLSYEDYLRLMLWLESGETFSYRLMDVLQLRMREQNAEFLCREYMVYAAFDLTVTAEYLYLPFPTTKRLTGAGERRTYSLSAAWGY